MPPRSKVELFPSEVRAEFEEMLVERRFAGLQEIADYFTEKGFAISKSGVSRYADKLKTAVEQARVLQLNAKAYNLEVGEDQGEIEKMVAGLLQNKTMEAALAINPEKSPVQLSKLITGFANLYRTGIRQREFQLKLQDRLKRLEAARDAARQSKKPETLTEAVDAFIADMRKA